MPIYAYRCAECGFQKDHLQKVSDPLLTECPECGKASYKKMLTAAGFQLKGTGWYVTDFKGGGAKPATAVATESKVEDASKPAAKIEGAAKTESAAPAKSESAAAPAAAPAASTPSSSST
ncbi:MAG: zinc ribbon domain-containing protein [Proteobacteria bacterium]|nr:zinc ribbon domain-containing protein [Pseudomonadota bacterium]